MGYNPELEHLDLQFILNIDLLQNVKKNFKGMSTY